jgi:hypothetical protein
MNSNFQTEDDCPSKYKLIKLYAFIDDGYLLFSINKNLHKQKHDCFRVPSKDTDVIVATEE